MHHALVALGQVIHILFAYLPHLLQLIGQRRRKVVVGVLALLPSVGVGVHGHNDLIHQLDGVIHADGDNINGEHHVPGVVHKLGNHGVLDEAGIIPKKQGAPKTVVHLKIALFEGQAPRRDSVLEVMTALHGFVQVKMELLLLAGTEEVMEQAQTLVQIDFADGGIQTGQTGSKVGSHTVEKALCFFVVSGFGRDRDVLLLNEIVAVSGLVCQQVVVLPTVLIQPVALVGHEQVCVKLPLI